MTVYQALKNYLQDPDVVAKLAYVDPDTSEERIPPIRFENENFTPPNPPAPWLAMEVFGILSGQESIGASVQADNRWDETGYVSLKVLVASGTGSDQARQIAADIRLGIFRGLTLMDGNLEFLEANESQGGPSEEVGNWFEIPITIQWRHVEA